MNTVLLTLLQVEVTGETHNVTAIELIKQGGVTMIPLFILAVVAVYVFVERLITISKANKKTETFMPQVREHISKSDLEGALAICEQNPSPASRMIEKGIRRLGSPVKSIEDAIENVGKIEIDRLEKNLSLLATIAGAAPMVGFLGTVLGMINTFLNIAHSGNTQIDGMAGGISEAMVTTATGLIVGILAYVTYNFLSARLQRVIHSMEHSSIEFLDLLHEPQN